MHKKNSMLRIQKLKLYYQELLKNKGIKDFPDFIQSIVNADITKEKYTRFLIESFLNDKFLEEDLMGGLESTIGQAISLFHKHKHKLPEDMRSVFKYNSPGDLWNSVKQYQGELSGKELKKEEQEKIYRETEFVYKDENTGFQIVCPLTKESAQWWGKETRWCTSADNNNMFNTYAKKAPLFILLMPDKQKIQLWKNGNKIQFMDKSDNKVSLEYIEQYWTTLEPICKWLNDLQHVPMGLRTKEFYESAIQSNGHTLQHVPEELKTKELCKLAVKQNGHALQHVPNHLMTEELCEIVIKQNGEALKWVPEYLKTKELCELAIKQNGFALHYVPDGLRTKELCELAIKQNGWALQYTPEQYRTKELCELAVKQNGWALRYVPLDLKTIELCEIAIKQNGCLCHVPYKYRTKELCELAVQQNGDALEHVPLKLRTKELCELAVKQDGDALEYVPEELKKELQHVKKEIFKLPMDRYQETFQEIKALFLIKDISLDYHS
jgi:uncharacterized protein YbdZ (MbtH family)